MYYLIYRFLQKYPEYPKPYEAHKICLDEVAKELSEYLKDLNVYKDESPTCSPMDGNVEAVSLHQYRFKSYVQHVASIVVKTKDAFMSQKNNMIQSPCFLGERGGSVVECRTPEREVRGSRPTAAVLCP